MTHRMNKEAKKVLKEFKKEILKNFDEALVKYGITELHYISLKTK